MILILLLDLIILASCLEYEKCLSARSDRYTNIRKLAETKKLN